MIYLYYGLNVFLIEREIDKIIKSNNVDKLNVFEYNLENDLIDNILDDAETISLFGDKKVIIVNNSYIFTGSSKKKLEHNLDLLTNYISNPNPSTILIFTIYEEKLDERKKIVKSLKDNTFEFSIAKDLSSFVKSCLSDYKMDSSVINKFIEYVGSDYYIIENEVEKLKLYKGDDKKITLDDVYLLCSENVDVDLNEFTNSIVSKNISKSLKIYRSMVNIGIEPIQIIIRLANQFRIIYQSKNLSNKGCSEKEIASILKIHQFRVHKALEVSYKYSSEVLLNLLKSLASLDEQIKTSSGDKNLSIELFILNL